MQVGYEIIDIFDQYLASSLVVNAATVKSYKHSAAGPWKVGDTHRWQQKAANFLIAADGRRSVYDMTRSLNVTPKTTKQYLIVHSGKSEAKVASIALECTVETKYWQT